MKTYIGNINDKACSFYFENKKATGLKKFYVNIIKVGHFYIGCLGIVETLVIKVAAFLTGGIFFAYPKISEYLHNYSELLRSDAEYVFEIRKWLCSGDPRDIESFFLMKGFGRDTQDLTEKVSKNTSKSESHLLRNTLLITGAAIGIGAFLYFNGPKYVSSIAKSFFAPGITENIKQKASKFPIKENIIPKAVKLSDYTEKKLFTLNWKYNTAAQIKQAITGKK